MKIFQIYQELTHTRTSIHRIYFHAHYILKQSGQCILGSTWSVSGSSPCTSCSTCGEYNKISLKHCGSDIIGSTHTSLASAQSACSSEPGCTGVYDDSCDDSGSYYLCGTLTYGESSSVGSCVYKKSSVWDACMARGTCTAAVKTACTRKEDTVCTLLCVAGSTWSASGRRDQLPFLGCNTVW